MTDDSASALDPAASAAPDKGAPKIVSIIAVAVCVLGAIFMTALYIYVVPAWEKDFTNVRHGKPAPEPPPPNAVILDSEKGDF